MIEVYNNKNTNYRRNGDITLTPIKCELVIELNGEIKIELTHKYDELGRWRYLNREAVIACPTPWSRKQLFRIYKIEKRLEEIKIYASHIFFDLRHKIVNAECIETDGKETLDIILKDTGYAGYSNIERRNTAYYGRKNVVESICGDDGNSFISMWKGEMIPDNYDLYIMDRIGEDKGVSVRFGYNLKDIKETVDMSEVITRIIPIGNNGIMLENPKPWVDSPNIMQYANVYEKVVEYNDIKIKEKDSDEGFNTLEEAREALKKAAKKDFEDGVDEPKVNYVVNMAMLENTEEYKQYKTLSSVGIGDTVRCSNTEIEIEVKARCIKITWDCIREKIIEIELGQYINTFLENQRSTNLMLEKVAGNTYTKNQVDEIAKKYWGEEYVTNESMKEEIKKVTGEMVKEKELEEKLGGYVDRIKYEEEIGEIKKMIENLGK